MTHAEALEILRRAPGNPVLTRKVIVGADGKPISGWNSMWPWSHWGLFVRDDQVIAVAESAVKHGLAERLDA